MTSPSSKLLLGFISCMTGGALFGADLADEFKSPPQSAKPYVYWMWLRYDTTPAAITKDMEEMKAKGIAGFILYDSGAGSVSQTGGRMVLTGKEYRMVRTDDYAGATTTPIPGEKMITWTPHWRELIRFVGKEANRLGLDFVLTDGLAGTSGPIKEDYGMQKLVFSETAVAGPKSVEMVLPLENPPPLKRAPLPVTTHIDVIVLAVPDKKGFPLGDVIDLSGKMDAGGKLKWEAPAGAWKILRFSQAPTRSKNAWGYFNDGMSAEAMDKTWEVTMAPLLKEMTPEERAGLKGIQDDSWEAGDCTWTKRFADEFHQRRGYDLRPFLPVLADKTVVDADVTAGVMRDYKLTISELIADNHYGRLHQLARENGLLYYSECAGPHPTQQDLLKNSKEVDRIMGEFWVPSPHRTSPPSRFLLRNAANANHLYGKAETLCEAFTSVGPYWEDTFFGIKGTADQAFCDGLTRVAVHNYSHSPSLTAKPGYAYFAGTFYNRGVTWWEQTPAFNAYLSRCSHLLQQGKFVADALIYRGDSLGQLEPMKLVQPTLGEGYDHDNVDTEVLLTRVSAKDGRLVLPDGMSYRVLVLPENTPMGLEVLKKVAALVDAGATVVGPRPVGMAGLVLHPEDKTIFDTLVTRLWGGEPNSMSNHKGLRQVVSGPTAREVLQSAGVAQDFEQKGLSPAGTIDWIHRTTPDAEIYYVASRWEPTEKIACTFRVTGRQPELWDPVTGEMRTARSFRQENGRTTVPLELGPCGSVFIVFRKPIKTDATGTMPTNYPAVVPRQSLNGPWTVHFDPKWGGPESVNFDRLVDWTKRPEEGIQHYSGTAVYHETFDLAAAPVKGERLLLDLGEVREVGSVKLNGVDLGVVWTKPARVDITAAVKPVGNVLEVTVVNLWPNRMIGDASLPPDKQFTVTNMRKFSASSPLLPSGLLGPVQLLSSANP